MHDDKEPIKRRPKRKRPANQLNKDIAPMLEGWEFESGSINVRKITGNDGLPKIQMRLDLGLLQMEMHGRPDGVRPHGHESLLDYFEAQLKDHSKRNGTELGFHLTPAQCQSLREEAVMYYQRYLSLFVLGEFIGVARDTARNLRLLDICGQFADDEQDRMVLEQYRPYILMMNTRALAQIQLKRDRPRRALSLVKRGLRELKQFFEQFGQGQAFRHAGETRILRQFAREIQGNIPMNPRKKLELDLRKAIKAERYEDAAQLRDQIARIDAESGGSPV